MNLSPTVAVKLSWFGTKNGEVRPLTSRACSHASVVRVVHFGVEHFLWNIWVAYVMERNINDPVTTSLLLLDRYPRRAPVFLSPNRQDIPYRNAAKYKEKRETGLTIIICGPS